MKSAPIPLREVIAQLALKARKLNSLDDKIGRSLSAIEEGIRRRRSVGGPVNVMFPPWGKLGWSGRRGRWRLVVINDEACRELYAMPRQCCMEACFVLGTLIRRLGIGIV